MGEIKLGSVQMFINGQPLSHCDLVEMDMEFEDIKDNDKIVGHIPAPRKITFECKVKRNDMLSLIYGQKITNNWLKMHGGVMSRKIRKRKS